MKQVLNSGQKAYQVLREPLAFISTILQLGALLLSLIGFIFGYETLVETSTGSQPLGFAVRLMVLIACSIGLGAGLGMGIIYLTKHNTALRFGLAVGISIFWAAFLVAVVDALSVTSSALPDFSLFAFTGLAFVLGILTFLFRAKANSVSLDIIEQRALMIAVFAATTAAFGLVVNVGRVIG